MFNLNSKVMSVPEIRAHLRKWKKEELVNEFASVLDLLSHDSTDGKDTDFACGWRHSRRSILSLTDLKGLKL